MNDGGAQPWQNLEPSLNVSNQHVNLFSAGWAIHCGYKSLPQEPLEMLEGVAPSQEQLGDMFYGRVVPMKYSLCLAIMSAIPVLTWNSRHRAKGANPGRVCCALRGNTKR